MRVSLNYPLHLAAESRKDGVRLVLQHVMVQKDGEPDKNGVQKGIAIAADGYLLALVPVELDEGDVPGLVSANVWELAFKEHRKLSRQSRELPVVMLLREDTVTLPFQGMTLPRCHKGEAYGGVGQQEVKYDSTFPDVNRIVPERTPAGEEERGPWSLRSKQLQVLEDVLGAKTKHHTDLVLTRNKSEGGPLLVEVVAPQEKDAPYQRPNVPYAVLMPVGLPGWVRKGSRTS